MSPKSNLSMPVPAVPAVPAIERPRRDLAELFAPLNHYRERIFLTHSLRWLCVVDLRYEELLPFVQFDPNRYVRNLVCAGPMYQALVLCWRSGQRSPIHDHQGSTCAVKVLRGEATETTFAPANGMIVPVQTRRLAEGSVCGSQDDDIHQVSNLQADDADLVTLHIYSPPLLEMNVYSLYDASVMRVFDPIRDEFVLGGGI